jgi:nitroimidazol reductase NimA-like FMN-containing flavoprotein (pyridoxamine 5'-phosphate oxidase superfamily)
LEDINEKINGLNHLMKHQTGKDIKYDFNENDLNKIIVYKISVSEFTGKQKVL